MTEQFTTMVYLLSPVILAGLLVYWVYNLQSGLNKLRKEAVESNNAVAQAFNSLALRVNNITAQNAANETTSETQ